MAREFSRSERVGDSIHKELSQVLQHKFRDPRVGMINVTAVKVSNDLSTARAYVTFVAEIDEASRTQQIQVLNNAAGYLRTQVSKAVSMRMIPRIYFVYDESVDYGQKMSALIDKAIQKNRQS